MDSPGGKFSTFRDWDFISGQVECEICEGVGLEGQREQLKPYEASIAINLWGYDLLQKRNTQTNIPPIS